MTRFKVVLNRAGVGAILKSPAVHKMVDAAAEQIANGARARGAQDVVVESYTTDRGAAAVVVRDRDAAGQEAKHGILSGPAQAIGAQVKKR